MMCCISASGKKLQLYQLCQGKTARSLNKFKKYKCVTLELSGARQSLAWFNKTHLIKYINDTSIPHTHKQPSLLSTYHRGNEIKQLYD